jgi:integrase
LLLGVDAKPKKIASGPNMRWAEFRDGYSRLKVSTFRSEEAMKASEIVLDVCESILQPRTLAYVISNETLAKLQAELLAGTKSRKGKRSPFTVQSHMETLKAAFNWAHKMGWLPTPCKFEMLSVDNDDGAKGRPLTEIEFKRVLKACGRVCPSDSATWRFLLKGMWESGLRISEAMVVSWDDDYQIMPLRVRSGGYLLRIPARLQKNRKTQEIPTTPQFGALIDEVPNESRSGWVFNPSPRRGSGRLTADQVERIISELGKEAEVFVTAEGKPASAHDLRRSFGQRMADAGLPPRDLQAIIRHASLATTEKYYLRHRAADQAERIARYLARDVYPEKVGTRSEQHEKTAPAESP